MPRWLPKVLTASLDIGLDEEDACDILANLKAEDSDGRLESSTTGEWMYLFKPQLAGTVLYIKLVLRDDSGGVVACPACAHRFTGTGSATECPECGLALGAAANAVPDEARSS